MKLLFTLFLGFSGLLLHGAPNATMMFVPSCNDDNEIVIEENITWDDNDIIVNCDIRIKPGATLTIDGARVKIARDVHINVMRGATLTVLNEAVLTAFDEVEGVINRWKGIYVQGNRWRSQEHPDCGKVNIANSTVEFAATAITTRNADDPGDGNYSGGRISLSDSDFKNNGRSVEFLAYNRFLNGSVISDCLFTINQEYLKTGRGFIAHVTSFRNNFYDLGDSPEEWYGNTFELSNHQTLAESFPGFTGVILVQSSIELADNKFFRTSTGLLVENSLTAGLPENLLDVSLFGCTFEDNITGARISGGDLKIVQNAFFIERSNNESETEPSRGLWIDNSTGYLLAENTFTGAGWLTSGHEGLRIDCSGPDMNYVQLNNFREISRSLAIYGQNAGEATGLVVKCNSFNRSIYPISIYGSSDIESQLGGLPGINTYQDNSQFRSAGNTFSTTGQGIRLLDNAPPIVYWYTPSSNSANEWPGPVVGPVERIVADIAADCSLIIPDLTEQDQEEEADIILGKANSSYPANETYSASALPNPTSGILSISINAESTDVKQPNYTHAQVTAMSGRTLTLPVSGYDLRYELDLSGLPTGVYQVQLLSAEDTISLGKIVKR